MTTFEVTGHLADFHGDPLPGMRVTAAATPPVKVGDATVHSNTTDAATTDAAGAFTLTLVTLPGVWFTISGPHPGVFTPVTLAGYVPDPVDPTTGVELLPGTVIDLADIVTEDPTPGYNALALTIDPAALTATIGAAIADAPVTSAQTAAFVGKVETANTVAVSGAAQTIPDVTVATLNVITLSAACTLTFPAAAVGKSFSLVLVSGGAFDVTWPATVKWRNSIVPVLTTTAGKSDAVSFVCADGTNWLGFVGGKAF